MGLLRNTACVCARFFSTERAGEIEPTTRLIEIAPPRRRRRLAVLLAYTVGYTTPVRLTSLLATSARDVSLQWRPRRASASWEAA